MEHFTARNPKMSPSQVRNFFYLKDYIYSRLYVEWYPCQMEIMNDPAANGRGFRQEFSFKSSGKPRGLKPTGGIQGKIHLLQAQLPIGKGPQSVWESVWVNVNMNPS